MTRLLSLSVLWLVASMTAFAVQAPVDFSGRWTMETPPPLPAPPAAAPPATMPPAPGAQAALRGDMGSGWGPTITIAQDAKQLAVEYVIYTRYDLQPPLKLVFALDGSESRNTLMLGRGAQTQASRTSWEGQTLNIKTVFAATDPGSGKPFTTEVTQKLSLESPTSLVVEVTRSGALGGPSSTTRTVYKKG